MISSELLFRKTEVNALKSDFILIYIFRFINNTITYTVLHVTIHFHETHTYALHSVSTGR